MFGFFKWLRNEFDKPYSDVFDRACDMVLRIIFGILSLMLLPIILVIAIPTIIVFLFVLFILYLTDKNKECKEDVSRSRK